MAESYGLKYYKAFRSRQEAGGEIFQLEIRQRGLDASFRAMEIGDWQGMSLEIDGDDDPVSPVQKTILTFSMVDSADRPDTDAVKYGNWQEFYTPDSTLYKVVVRKGEEGNDIWTGYITPDNWQESLGYRGTVTVTARDNIGHLQDFDFDMNADKAGTVSIAALIWAALDKVAYPMEVGVMLSTVANSDYIGIVYDGEIPFPSFRVNVAHFEGKTWQDAFEEVLSSLGLCFRYVGGNRAVLTYLRYLPLLGAQGRRSLPAAPVLFLGGGTRTLSPAYRKLTTTVDFKSEDKVEFNPMEGLDLSGSQTYDFRVRNMAVDDSQDDRFKYLDGTGSYALNKNSSAVGWQPAGAFFNAAGYSVPDAPDYGAVSVFNADSTVLLAANRKSGTFTQTYGFGTVHIPSGKISVTIDRNFYGVDKAKKVVAAVSSYISSVAYVIKYISGGISYYWDGSKWTKALTVMSADYSEGVETLEFDFSNQNANRLKIEPDGELYLAFDGIVFSTGFFGNAGYQLAGYTGIYMGVKGISLQMPESAESLNSDTVTTVNDEAYNVTCDEDRDLGFLSREVGWQTPGNYVNTIYYENDGRVIVPVGYVMGWNGASRLEPFPTILHRQILMYHHSTMQMLEGDCMPAQPGAWDFGSIATYKGHSFLLQGGTYDFVSGEMSGARLREFEFYEDLWADTYTVRLTGVGENRLAVIKAIAGAAGLPPLEAKYVADNAPADVGSGFTLRQAENIKEAIEAAGGTATVIQD